MAATITMVAGFDEVVAKFKLLADGVVSDATAEATLETAWRLDTLSDITPLFSFDVIE